MLEEVVKKVKQHLFEELEAQKRSENMQQIVGAAASAKAGLESEIVETFHKLGGVESMMQNNRTVGVDVRKKISLTEMDVTLHREECATVVNKEKEAFETQMEAQNCERRNFRIEMEQLCGERNSLKKKILEPASMVHDASREVDDLRFEKVNVKARLTQVQREENKYMESGTQERDESNQLATTLVTDRYDFEGRSNEHCMKSMQWSPKWITFRNVLYVGEAVIKASYQCTNVTLRGDKVCGIWIYYQVVGTVYYLQVLVCVVATSNVACPALTYLFIVLFSKLSNVTKII